MPAIAISPQRRDEILDALRRGIVPASSLDLLAVGLEPFEATLRAELGAVRAGRGMFKAVRGEYGSGKTFFARWFEELARREGFATSEVQISETETPLHRLETVYRRLVEQSESERIVRLADDSYIADLSTAVVGALGGKIGITPRVYLKNSWERSSTVSTNFRSSIPISTMR